MSTSQYAYAMAAIDTEERDRLLLEHLPQVQYLARRIHDRLPSHVPLADMVQAGMLGLIDALNKYDSNRNVQFKSYAAFRIRGAILDSLRDIDWGPRDLRRRAREVQDAANRLELRLGRSPTEPEIAGELRITLDEFQRLLGELRGLDLGSLEADGTEGDEAPRDIPSNPEQSPFSYCLREEVKSALTQAISELPEKEQKVLALYYYEELTMKDIGAVLGVGESRVSQIHSLALVRLRGRLECALPQTITSRTVSTHG